MADPSAARYDVVVVGAGINGAGVAQAAAAAGHSVLVLEKTGIAAGTSSASSKLIHGGLRYLESWHWGLVRESLAERALLLKLAPELVALRDFNIPIYRTTRRGPWLVRAGLSLYFALSGGDRSATFRRLPRARWEELDGLTTEGLRAVFRYRDAQTDDRLLTEAVIASAQRLGAELACPAQFVGAMLHEGGSRVDYREGGREHSVSATVLVNAAGPWVNRVVDRIRPALTPRPIELVAGTHIVVPGRLAHGIYYVESPRDGRAVFVMPWRERILVGTTETRFRRHPDYVAPLRPEITYLVNVLKRYFPAHRDLRADDVGAAFAGLRVLPSGSGHAFHRSRETVLEPDRPASQGKPRVLSVYGGKLTTYRATAAKILARIRSALPDRPPRADTRELPLTLP